ncbi:MAG: Ig-like domain-containing domain [Sphingobacteriaceae bacterium]
MGTLLLLGACASIQTPLGGPKDTLAPKVKKENPKNFGTNFQGKKIEIEFDEFIKLNNAFTEIGISPALESPLDVKTKKSLLEININNRLEPNTTYTINFGKAIGDVNENNLVKNYSYVFSTGPVLDSLSVSGTVKSALTNETLKDITVFLLPISQDSLFGKKKPSIYTLSDEKGNFKLNNLKATQYHIYALGEKSPDRIYNRGVDEIGFLDTLIDLKKNMTDLSFRLFKEEPAEFKIIEKRLDNDGRILLNFNKGLPALNIRELGNEGTLKNAPKEFSLKNDSVSIWLPEIKFDSLKVGIYDGDKLVDRANILRNKRESLNRQPILSDNLFNNKLKPGSVLEITGSMPLTLSDSSRITLLADSVLQKGWKIIKKEGSERKYILKYSFKPEKNYVLKVSDGAFTGISGIKTKAYAKKFIAEGPDNYGNLSLTVNPADLTQKYVIQLLNDQKNVVREDLVKGTTVLRYTNYNVGKYSIRLVLDKNKNGKWDTGNLETKTQPEKMWYYEKVITLRANWDLEEKISLPKDL